jgi:DisA bacterial checkpoint controller nucleotide-binding
MGHSEASRHVTNLNLRGTIKELAQPDGGFVVSREGIVLSACRYLDAVAAQVDVPLGLGSRHIAAANMSAVTKAVSIVVSESSVVRLFCHGQLVGEIIPEVWVMDHARLGGTVIHQLAIAELRGTSPSHRIIFSSRQARVSPAPQPPFKCLPITLHRWVLFRPPAVRIKIWTCEYPPVLFGSTRPRWKRPSSALSKDERLTFLRLLKKLGRSERYVTRRCKSPKSNSVIRSSSVTVSVRSGVL